MVCWVVVGYCHCRQYKNGDFYDDYILRKFESKMVSKNNPTVHYGSLLSFFRSKKIIMCVIDDDHMC